MVGGFEFLKKEDAETDGWLFFAGPIVRINPYELSIHDPEFYDEVYVTSSVRRTNAYEGFFAGIGVDGKPTSKRQTFCLIKLT